MSNQVLDYFREREPRFREVSDHDLTLYIGERHPDFLNDEGFRDVFSARREQSANAQATAQEGTLRRRAFRVGEGLTETAQEVAETAGSAADPYTTGRALRDAAAPVFDAGMKAAMAESERGRAQVRQRMEMARTNLPLAIHLAGADAMSPAMGVLKGVGGVVSKTAELLREDAGNVLGLTDLDPSGPVSQGLQDAAGSVPVVVGGMALQSAGVPAPLAFGLLGGSQTLAETDDPVAAGWSAAKMALIPEVHGASRSVAAGGVRALTERGLFPAGAETTQKVVEALGGQLGVQGFLEAMNLPEYVKMTPEQRVAAIKRNLVANTAFLAMDVPGVVSKGPSQTQAGLSPQARVALAMRGLVNDPAAVEALKYVADEVAMRGLDSRRRATEPVPYNVRGPDAARDVDWRGGTPDPVKPVAAASGLRDLGPFLETAAKEAETRLFHSDEHRENWINHQAALARQNAISKEGNRRANPEYALAEKEADDFWAKPHASRTAPSRENPLSRVGAFSRPDAGTGSHIDATGAFFVGPVNEHGTRRIDKPDGLVGWVRPGDLHPEQIRLLEANRPKAGEAEGKPGETKPGAEDTGDEGARASFEQNFARVKALTPEQHDQLGAALGIPESQRSILPIMATDAEKLRAALDQLEAGGKAAAPKPEAKPPETSAGPKRVVFQGRGNTPEQIYGAEAVKEGRAGPLFGRAQYYAHDPAGAEAYGKVTRHEIEPLKKPFALNSDAAWFRLLKEAEAPHLNNMDQWFYKEPHKVLAAGEKVQKFLRERGYDGIEITLDPAGDSTRRLAAMAGHDQTIVFGDEAKPAEKPKPAAGPEIKPVGSNEVVKGSSEIVVPRSRDSRMEVVVAQTRDGKWVANHQVDTSRAGSIRPWFGPFETREAAVRGGLDSVERFVADSEGRSDTTAAERKDLANLRKVLDGLRPKPAGETKAPDDGDAPSPVGSVESGYKIQGGEKWPAQQRIDHANRQFKRLIEERKNLLVSGAGSKTGTQWELKNNRALKAARLKTIAAQLSAWDAEANAARKALTTETGPKPQPVSRRALGSIRGELDEARRRLGELNQERYAARAGTRLGSTAREAARIRFIEGVAKVNERIAELEAELAEYKAAEDAKAAEAKAAEEAKRGPREAPGEVPADIAALLKVPDPDQGGARAEIKVADELIADHRKHQEHYRQQVKEFGRKVLRTTGPSYMRGRIKTSAKKADVDSYRSAQQKVAEIERVIEDINASLGEKRNIKEQSENAAIVNDPTQPLWRRLRRRRAMLDGKQSNAELVAKLVEAESDAVDAMILKRYPDATPEEVAALRMQFNTYHTTDVDREFETNPKLNLANLRKREAELKEQGAARESARKLAEEKTAEEKATAEANAKRRADEEAKIGDLIEEAQRVADSAPKQGSAEAKATGLTAAKVKTGLIERIQKALAEAPDEVGGDGKPSRVVIGVPGDGVFVLSNTRKTLAETLKRAKSMETATTIPQEAKATSVKAPKLSEAKTGEFKKLLEPFVSQSESRFAIVEPWSDGKRTLATDGRIAVELKGSAGEGGPEGFPVAGLDSMWGKNWEVGPFTVASDDLWRAGRIARRMEADKNGNRFIELTGRKGGIYAEMTDSVGDFASYGKSGEGESLGAFQGSYIEDLAELARKLNNSEVRIGLKRTEAGQKLLVVEGDKFRSIVMGKAEEKPAENAKGEAEGEQVEGYPPEAGTEPRTEPTTAVEEDLFANTVERAATEEGYPGGPLGTEPSHPANDPQFSVFPMELPEAVHLARQLLGGKTPKLVEKIRALGGRALGVFRHNDSTGEGSIEMIRSVFDLPESERQRLMSEAQAYADMVGASDRERAAVVARRYELLKRQEFLHNPVVALKVLWHEIGHVVDWLPDHTIQGRGNLLGRLASLKDYLKDTLPEAPGLPDNPITAADRDRLRAEAHRQMVAEVGPLEEIVRKIMVEEPEWRIRGVTPEDVRNLFGMSAREQYPELYLWFAEQPAAVKKEIVKAAMRNMVDPRLTRFQSREQVGTRMVEREIRERKGRAPTPEEIQKRFQDLLRAEIRQRRLVELAEVKAELEPLIAWWRGVPKMEVYFAKSSEMYAEAFSIFANNPAAMALRAPTYYRVLMNYMDAKPEVAALYRQIQEQIRSGTLMGDRVQRLRESWNRDDEQSLARLDQGGKVPVGQWIDNVRYHLDRRFGPVYRVAGGSKRNPQVREALGNMLYRAADHERFLGAVNRQVARPMGQVNLEWNDLAEYLFHQHVVGSRFRRSPDNGELVMLGNPHGWTPKNSLERLDLMKQQLGPERWAVLEAAHQNMRQIYQKEVIDLLNQTQMFGPELMAAIEERIFYAPFQASKGEVTDGIEALLEDSFGPEVGARVYRQVGNLGDIKNPATALVLKGTSLQSAAYRNEGRRQTVLAMLEAEPEWIQKAQIGPGGRPYFRETDKVGTISFLRDGKVHAYYVPRTIADSVNGGPPIRSLATMGAMKAARGVKALLTQLNAGWWPFAFVKDAASWVLQVPKAGPLDYARHIVPALRSSLAYASQGYSPLRQDILAAMGGPAATRRVTESGLVEEALGRKMLISHADYGRNQDQVANEFDRKLVQVGLDPVFWGQQMTLGQKFHRAWQRYKGLGQALERSHKIAGMTYLDEAHPNMPEWQKAEIVRERAGSPDFLQRGHMSPQVELLGMFLNPWKEGVRSMLKAGRDSPGTFAAKVAAGIMGPSVFQALLSSGIAGDDMKRKYRSISDYDKSNYFVVPLGWQDEKRTKTAYLRIPLPDSFRLLHSLVWHGLTGEDRGLGAVVGGNIPGVSPLLVTGAMWASYMQGHNPYDSFRGRELLNPDVFTTGGWPAHAELLKATWNQLGGAIVHRFQSDRMDDPPPAELEKVLEQPGISNVVGRWIKVSGTGWADEARRAAQPVAVQEAAHRIAGRDIASAILDGRPLTDAQKALAHQPKVQAYLYEILARAQKGRVGLPSRAIQRLPSKAQRQAAELEQIRQGR